MKRKSSYDFYLILATVGVLFVISLICIWGMFYFKFAQLHQMEAALKAAHMQRMNTIIAPFLIGLILLLAICVPKRLLPTKWLNGFAGLLAAVTLVVAIFLGIRAGLLVVLAVSLLLQAVVLALALAGSRALHFEKKGYWVRVGSSLMHLGLILFVFDLFFHRQQTLHLVLFWITTVATVLGMLFCFYAESVVRLLGRGNGAADQAAVDGDL